MGWSMDRQGIRTLFDRESNRLKQFELSGPRRERVSLDTYPDELAARDAEFRQEARYGKWSEPAQQSHGLRFNNFRVSWFSVQDGGPADVVGMKKNWGRGLQTATALAALVAPYRHARLSAVKLAALPAMRYRSRRMRLPMNCGPRLCVTLRCFLMPAYSILRHCWRRSVE
jgi:hypothetical protein